MTGLPFVQEDVYGFGADNTEAVIRDLYERLKKNLPGALAELSNNDVILPEPGEIAYSNPLFQDFPALELIWLGTRRTRIIDAEDDECSEWRIVQTMEIDLSLTVNEDETSKLFMAWFRYAEAVKRALRYRNGVQPPFSRLSFDEDRFIEQGTLINSSLHLRRGVISFTVETDI